MCRDTLYKYEAMQDQTKKESIQAVALWPYTYVYEIGELISSEHASLPVLNDILGEDPVCIVHNVLIVAGDVALQRVHGSASSTVVH